MSRQPPSKTHSYHHGNLRAALLAEARALLEEGGAASLSLREIARRVGVAAPSAYHHFGSLEAIAVALAQDGFAELAATLEQGAIVAKGRLLGVGRAYVHFAIGNPGLYRLMFGDGFKLASSESEEVRVLRRRSYEILKVELRKRRPEEEIAASALFLWSLVHGLALLMIDGQIENNVDVDKMIDSVLHMSGTGLPRST